MPLNRAAAEPRRFDEPANLVVGLATYVAAERSSASLAKLSRFSLMRVPRAT
jgi:hypothetical protein